MNGRLPVRKRDAVTTSYGLLDRLQNWDDQRSWNYFFETYWRLIYSLAIRAGLTEADARDVLQETVLCVAKDIHKFQRDRTLGSFKGWLRNLTRWRIADHFRARNAHDKRADPVSGEDSFKLDEIPDSAINAVDSYWDEEWQLALFKTALERVRRRIKDEQYQIFDLYVVKHWPVVKVARRLGVSVAKIYVTKHRVATLVKREIQTLEAEALDGSVQ
jgi:RNA polymerase sigma factor (sigma-70 family)